MVGFTIYRIFTFRKEVEHYSPTITNEGNLDRKDFRILLPYTPENPDRLLRYAIRLAKENDAEINIMRTITVPDQTPLSAGVAFIDSARKAFDPLQEILNKEGIISHYFVRISHDATEAVLSTVAEQKIHLLIIDYETIKNNKKLQTLLTCDLVAILPHSGDNLIMEKQYNNTSDKTSLLAKDDKKNLVVLYDDGDNSDEILKVTNCFANTEIFNLNVVAINRKGLDIVNQAIVEKSDIAKRNYKSSLDYAKRKEYFEQAGVEFNEIYVTEDIEKDGLQFGKVILKSIFNYNPDIVIMESTIGKYSLFEKSSFSNLLMYRLNCPILIVKDFSFPIVNIVKHILLKITGHLGPSYLLKLIQKNTK